MTSPVQSFTFNETAPGTARRANRPEVIVCGIIYASVILLLTSRVFLQLLHG